MKEVDLEDLVALDHCIFKDTWSEKQAKHILLYKNNCCLVIEQNRELVGFLAFSFNNNRFCLLKLGVRQELRRKGLGTMMISKLSSFASGDAIEIDVPEDIALCPEGFEFFKKNKFVATGIKKKCFDSCKCYTSPDAITFVRHEKKDSFGEAA